MNDREYKIKVLQAHKEGIINKAETKLLLKRGFCIPPIAWIGAGQSEHELILELKQKVFPGMIPVFTWAK